MIRVEESPPPENFDQDVRVPGERWLAGHPTGRPPGLWTRVTPALADAFAGRCAYAAMLLGAKGTVDHFVSVAEDRTRAYDWCNYRYASDWANRVKGEARAAELLDPFEVEDDWFEILLPSLQLVVTDRCPPALRARAAHTLERLRLGHDEDILRVRREWLAMYEEGELSQAGLARVAPLIARAVRKRDGLEPAA